MAWHGRIALKNHVIQGLVSVATWYMLHRLCDNYDFHEAENAMAYAKLYSKNRSNAPGLEMKMLASYVM